MTARSTKRIEFFTGQVDFKGDHLPMDDGVQPLARLRHPGGPDMPQMHEVKMPPNQGGPVHAHIEDEIMYVVAGEMIFGPNRLKAGDSLYIPGGVLYGFRAGPEGLHFLNFRVRSDRTNFKPEEFKKLQTLHGAEREAFIQENINRLRRAD